MINTSFLICFHFDSFQLDAQPVSVVSFGEVITVENNTISSKDVDMTPNAEILRLVILFFGHTHSWVMS